LSRTRKHKSNNYKKKRNWKESQLRSLSQLTTVLRMNKKLDGRIDKGAP
jgi:hypothetical protein